MRVEIVFAQPDRQVLDTLEVPPGATVADVIAASKLARQFPDSDPGELQAGIWGRPVARNQAVRDGDRVELYRSLTMDPREARRLRAGRQRSPSS